MSTSRFRLIFISHFRLTTLLAQAILVKNQFIREARNFAGIKTAISTSGSGISGL